MMKPWTMRLMRLGAVKCIGLCMRLELEESFCYLLCSLSEVIGRMGRVYKSAISDHCPLFFSSLDEYYFFSFLILFL